jgi:DNA-binding XRE family transcriptional regulator
MQKRKAAIKQDPIVAQFGARLRELRVSRGMTQAELARKAHVAAAYMWKLEGGAVAPGIDLGGPPGCFTGHDRQRPAANNRDAQPSSPFCASRRASSLPRCFKRPTCRR